MKLFTNDLILRPVSESDIEEIASAVGDYEFALGCGKMAGVYCRAIDDRLYIP